MNEELLKPWYRRFAHWQRDQSRALRKRLRSGWSVPISSRGKALTQLSLLCQARKGVQEEITARHEFLTSPEFDTLVARAAELEPRIVTPAKAEATYLAPWHDQAYFDLREAIGALPEGRFNSVILVPFGRVGGADLVAGILARALQNQGSVLILRTDGSDWDRPDWYPEDVPAPDVSAPLRSMAEAAPRALYTLLQRLEPDAIYNVNSRLAFECFKQFGARLARDHRLYAYYFCADRAPQGHQTGYPVLYAADVIPHLSVALVDSRCLSETLLRRYALPPEYAERVCLIYTPAQVAGLPRPVVLDQIATSPQRDRPLLLWAGRLDTQKLFGLVIEVARAMPDVDFRAWGKAVLDKKRKIRNLPGNLVLEPGFQHLDDLPLRDCDGWLYTSAWDGLPTILIELAARGMPVVASSVGGVPELVDNETGWPVEDWENAASYMAAIRRMLADQDERMARALALQERARTRHSQAAYMARLAELQALPPRVSD